MRCRCPGHGNRARRSFTASSRLKDKTGELGARDGRAGGAVELTTNGLAPPAGRLGVLAADAEAPEVSEAAVGADLLEPLEVLAELGVDAVGQDLVRLSIDDVLLPVEEPVGDLELLRVLDDGDDPLELVRVELAGPVR